MTLLLQALYLELPFRRSYVDLCSPSSSIINWSVYCFHMCIIFQTRLRGITQRDGHPVCGSKRRFDFSPIVDQNTSALSEFWQDIVDDNAVFRPCTVEIFWIKWQN